MDPGTNIQYLKGVGPARAALYQKLGISTLLDLLYHFPRSYIDLSRVVPIEEIPAGNTVAIRAVIARKYPEARIRRGFSLFKLKVADDSGEIGITLFNAKFTFDALKTGEEYIFYGSIKAGTRPEMAAPMIFPADTDTPFIPVYPLTAGLTSKSVSQNVRQALRAVGQSLRDPIPAGLRVKYQLCELLYALEGIHFPKDRHTADLARERLIFEELFTLSLALSRVRERSKIQTEIRIAPFDPGLFYDALPFSPTGAQRRVVDEILADLYKSEPMNRLLQGDVGSGKTLVAAAACLAVVRSGCQCAVMAPTEILAEQHRATFESFLSPFGIQVGLLTGSMTAPQKREMLARIADGGVQVAVGTHALLSSGVAFSRLGLAVTDEQHRFGVSQRAALQAKSENPHVLVMSATPIPRTLALIIYGDLDLSVLDELPKGRIKVDTYCIPTSKLPRAYKFIRQHLDEGRQAYIVCPLVSEEEETGIPGLVSAEQVARELCENEFRDYRVGILHGKLKATQKEQIMRSFKAGEIQLLICTTVIEVGVDVPNAVVMTCLNAERFGLSQLHQLRGRVGRGSHASSCILVSDARGQAARERLGAMCETSDGFKISEYDLKLRGPGDFFGDRQHGLPQMRIADMAENMDVLTQAQEAAQTLLEEDPGLQKPEHSALELACRRIMDSVGCRPN